MVQLKFKEQLTDLALDKTRDSIDYKIGDNTPDLTDNIDLINDLSHEYDHIHIEHSDNSSLIEAKNISKNMINTIEKKNLFSLPSIITIAFFLLSVIYIDLDQSLEDGTLSLREGTKIVYLFLGGIAQLFARGSEGAANVYTPKGLPGKHKEDFDKDGIPDHLDDTPWG